MEGEAKPHQSSALIRCPRGKCFAFACLRRFQATVLIRKQDDLRQIFMVDVSRENEVKRKSMEKRKGGAKKSGDVKEDRMSK